MNTESQWAAVIARRIPCGVDWMMARIPVWFAALTITLACSGCFPALFVERPGAYGRVVDSRTGAPISKATVTLSMSGPSATRGRVSIVTARNGAFSIPADAKWGMIFGPLDPGLLYVTLDFSAVGYASARREFHSTEVEIGSATKKIGIVSLNPSK